MKVNLYTDEECGCDSRDKSVLQEAMLAENFTCKELLEISLTLKVQKINKLVDPNLEQHIMILQGTEKIL